MHTVCPHIYHYSCVCLSFLCFLLSNTDEFTQTPIQSNFTTKGMSCLAGSYKDNVGTHIFVVAKEQPDHRCNRAPCWLCLNFSVCPSLSVSLPQAVLHPIVVLCLGFFKCSYTEMETLLLLSPGHLHSIKYTK